MLRRLKPLLYLVGCAGLLLLAERAIFGSWDHVMRYRFTMSIDDNGQIRTGTTVQELHCSFNDGLLKYMANAVNCGPKGDALVIDMGDKGWLFALMIHDEERRGESSVPSTVFIRSVLGKYGDFNVNSFVSTANKFGKTVDIPAGELPLLVRFADINDALTLERLNPKNIETIYGAGVKVASATVELTNDPINHGIKKLLLWNQGPKPWRTVQYLNGTDVGLDLRPDKIRIPIEAYSCANGD